MKVLWGTSLDPIRDGDRFDGEGFAAAETDDALLRALPPRITVVVSDPFYPDPTLPPRSARRDLHKKVYSFLCDTVSERRSYAHIEYLPAQDQNPAAR